MNEFRRLAARIDQHMQQLGAQGVNDPHAIIHRMMGYAPDLNQIWVGTSDAQLMALSNEFPGFHRYALLMQEAFEAERSKASRPYDGMAQFSGQHQQLAAGLLATAATLERGYQAFLGSGRLPVFQPQVREMDKLRQQWLGDLESFKSALRAQNPRHWRTSMKRSAALSSASGHLQADDGNFGGSGLQPHFDHDF